MECPVNGDQDSGRQRPTPAPTMLRPPELASRIRTEMTSVWEGAALSRYETERLAKDERHTPVSLSVFPIRDADSEIVVQHEHVELEPIIDDVIRELAPQIAAKGLRVSCDVPALD